MELQAKRGASREDIAVRARWALILSAVVTIALYVIPYGDTIAYPLLLLSTLVHELGHGVSAILVGGEFHRFEMYGDGSGVAYWSGRVDGAARAFVSAGGLVGPAVGAAIGFVCARHAKTSRYFMAALGAILVLALIFVVRNGFGFAFVGIFAAICIALAVYAHENVVQMSLAFLSVQLALATYSRGSYLFMKEAQTANGAMPSDSQHMAEALAGPYWLWGGLCAAFSAAVIVFGCWYFLRGVKRRTKVTRIGSTKLPSTKL